MDERKNSRRARRAAAALLLSTSISTIALVPPAVAAQSREEAWDAFVGSRYNYCDAKMIGLLWEMTPARGKVEIGLKILGGIDWNIDPLLRQSRENGNECGWEDTGLSYQDAETLAGVWGLATPYDAKLQAAEYYTHGQIGQVNSALGR